MLEQPIIVDLSLSEHVLTIVSHQQYTQMQTEEIAMPCVKEDPLVTQVMCAIPMALMALQRCSATSSQWSSRATQPARTQSCRSMRFRSSTQLSLLAAQVRAALHRVFGNLCISVRPLITSSNGCCGCQPSSCSTSEADLVSSCLCQCPVVRVLWLRFASSIFCTASYPDEAQQALPQSAVIPLL